MSITEAQPSAHSRTLMGVYGSGPIGKIINDNFSKRGCSLQMTEGNPNTENQDQQQSLQKIGSSEGKEKFWPTSCYKFLYLPNKSPSLRCASETKPVEGSLVVF